MGSLPLQSPLSTLVHCVYWLGYLILTKSAMWQTLANKLKTLSSQQGLFKKKMQVVHSMEFLTQQLSSLAMDITACRKHLSKFPQGSISRVRKHQ